MTLVGRRQIVVADVIVIADDVIVYVIVVTWFPVGVAVCGRPLDLVLFLESSSGVGEPRGHLRGSRSLSVNPLKGSGIRWLHFKVFSAIQV